MIDIVEQVAVVTQNRVFDMQVCVPSSWSDEEVLHFANAANPCCTSEGWFIRKEGSHYLGGDPERVPCEERDGMVHIMLDA